LGYPFYNGDVVISAGWMDSQKEHQFSKVKAELSGLYIFYLVYDAILALKNTRIFYHESDRKRFEKYLNWISNSCDFIFYGGQTAKHDAEEIQANSCWPTLPGAAISFGTDLVKATDSSTDLNTLSELGIRKPFVITVGSLEPRKNHDTLYKAYLMALTMSTSVVPQLVICGRVSAGVDDLVDSLDRDPRLKGTVIRMSPTDVQLGALYRHCLFTLLPSIYEGWSLTLPESLAHGKFCLAADTPPLREIGQQMIDYIPAWDVRAWAEGILFYTDNKDALRVRETHISKQWKAHNWVDTATALRERVDAYVADNGPKQAQPQIWMDITISYLYWEGGITGIIRTELTFAKYLNEIFPDVRYFAWSNNEYFEVKRDMLQWLFDGTDLSVSYKLFRDYWDHHESAGTAYRDPFKSAGGAQDGRIAILDGFPHNSILLFTCIDWDQQRSKAAVQMCRKSVRCMTSQLLYDFTPILVPHLHPPEACKGYLPFVKFVSNEFDHLLYGGRTAQRDGIKIQKDSAWRTPPSDHIEFGTDISQLVDSSQFVKSRDAAVLARLGIGSNYIMTVGTLEPRKNHETLYKAYLTILERADVEPMPQMLFVGKQAWKSKDFLSVLQADSRVNGRILLLSPTDEELGVLYRNCRFTLLPSFYEGWSLTLPESLSYGKFCLTSDVEPLREAGRDLVEYINPLDTFAWADRIAFYLNNPEAVAEKEDVIRRNWKPLSWRRSTRMLLDAILDAHQKKFANEFGKQDATAASYAARIK
jgi:glycosyltransferase involved in cell wall biosynthesis